MLTFLFRAIRISAVFLFGSTGEILTEKSGHLNLGIPGVMCAGAIGGIYGEYLYYETFADVSELSAFPAVMIPLLMAIAFSALMGLIYAFMTVTLRCNQNVTGLTITTFGVGLATFLSSIIGDKGFGEASEIFSDPMVSGTDLNWFEQLFLSYGFLFYLAIAIAIVVSIVLRKTRTGLNLRAVGENPATADAAGINVTRYKYTAILVGSMIAGLGGLMFIMDIHAGAWVSNNPVEGYGWLAVAIVIFAVWRPTLAIFGSLLFAFLCWLPQYFTDLSSVETEVMNILPYMVTIVVLVLMSVRRKKETQPPAALGLSYFREER